MTGYISNEIQGQLLSTLGEHRISECAEDIDYGFDTPNSAWIDKEGGHIDSDYNWYIVDLREY